MSSLGKRIGEVISELSAEFEAALGSEKDLGSELAAGQIKIQQLVNGSKEFTAVAAATAASPHGAALTILSSLACSCAVANALQQELVRVAKATYSPQPIPQEIQHRCVDLWAKVQSQRALLSRSIDNAAELSPQSLKARLETLRDVSESLLLEINSEFGRLVEFRGGVTGTQRFGLQGASDVVSQAARFLSSGEFTSLRGSIGAQVAEIA